LMHRLAVGDYDSSKIRVAGHNSMLLVSWALGSHFLETI